MKENLNAVDVFTVWGAAPPIAFATVARTLRIAGVGAADSPRKAEFRKGWKATMPGRASAQARSRIILNRSNETYTLNCLKCCKLNFQFQPCSRCSSA
jgi:hypothetical protein